jgi:hypothetical protein
MRTFRFEPELDDMMNQSIEMGRAFIIKEYQQKPCMLFSCFGKEYSYHFAFSGTQIPSWWGKHQQSIL